ncbi:hypothetical protein HY491_00570 [Candidatus Woesearchaeota archaeon]|nr:hypothetical protein [Candidatus Woesearchaeota archaeon]
MAKEGQLFSTDAIIGSVIFLVAIAVFYANLRTIQPEGQDPFPLESEFLFNNIIAATAAYDRDHQDKLSFLNGSRIQEEQLTAIARFPEQDNYTFFKSLILGSLISPSVIADVCIFFTNTSGNIIPVSGRTGIGERPANPKILVEGAWGCNAVSERGKAAPECKLPYLYAREFRKPVIRQDARQQFQLAELHVLICGKEHA